MTSVCTIVRRRVRRAFLTLVLALLCFHTTASETDNFSLPPGKEFADLGDFLEALHTRALENGVRKVNSRIERALKLKDPVVRENQLKRCHLPDTLAGVVAAQFGPAPIEEARISSTLGSSWARDSFPDRLVRYTDVSLNLQGRTALDPRALMMFVQSSTVRAFNVYFGVDKLVHFHQLGFRYYRRYRELVRKGQSPDEARRNMIEYFADKAILAEGKGFGTIISGIYSNADMAANYAGFKFLVNLTEPVAWAGINHAPLVVRCGVFWRLNDHVRLHSGWFRPYVTDHWNEALNPSLYEASMRPHIREILQERAGAIVEFYVAQDGRPNEPAYFERLARDLSTYYGEPYGHSGEFEHLMHLGNTCIPALEPPDPGRDGSR